MWRVARIDDVAGGGRETRAATLTLGVGTRIGQLPTVDALQDVIREYAVIRRRSGRGLEQDAAAGPGQPAGRWLAGHEAGDLGRSIAPSVGLAGGWHGYGCALLVLAVLLVAAVVAVAVVLGLSR